MHKRPPGRPERGSETGMKILFSQASSAGAGGGSREPHWEPKAALGVQEEPLAPTMCWSWAFLHRPDGHSHPGEAHSSSCPVFPLRLAASFIFPCPWAGFLPFQADFSAPSCLLAFAPLPASCMFGQRRVMAPARPRHCCRSWGSGRAGAKGRAGLGLLCLCCWRVGMWLQWGWTLQASCVLPQLPSLLPGTQRSAGKLGRQQELAEPGLYPPSHLSLQENRPCSVPPSAPGSAAALTLPSQHQRGSSQSLPSPRGAATGGQGEGARHLCTHPPSATAADKDPCGWGEPF